MEPSLTSPDPGEFITVTESVPWYTRAIMILVALMVSFGAVDWWPVLWPPSVMALLYATLTLLVWLICGIVVVAFLMVPDRAWVFAQRQIRLETTFAGVQSIEIYREHHIQALSVEADEDRNGQLHWSIWAEVTPQPRQISLSQEKPGAPLWAPLVSFMLRALPAPKSLQSPYFETPEAAQQAIMLLHGTRS